MEAKFDLSLKFLILYPIPNVYSLPHDSVIKLFAKLKEIAISLSLANNLITESWGNEYTLGMGYRIKNLRLRSNLASNGNSFVGDLNAKIDLNLRKNITVIRNLEIDDNKVSAGQSVFSLKLSADYALSLIHI